MKFTSVFLLSVAAFAQTMRFTTGQAARLLVGQTSFTSQDPNSSDTILGGVSGIAYAADTLFVADANRIGAAPLNHRVLLFQGLSSMLPGPTAELPFDRNCPVCRGQATIVLGQSDFTTTTETIVATRSSLRLPTAVASDGIHLVVADTNHNRVLIWNRIPTTNNQPADVVVGQPDFTSASLPGNTPTAKSMRGPQGVWIQNGKLYVADTQNNRVLIYNRIPTSNGAAADVVLGQPDFTTFVQPDLTQQQNNVTAKNLLNPVSVSSDGTRLVVTDLGYNRVLLWNSIPTGNATAADVVIGQPDMTSSGANNAFTVDTTTGVETPVLCTTSNGTDDKGNATYPAECNATLNFPRFALLGGNRLFIADGGNDRILVFEQVPLANGASADTVIGQIGGTVNQASDAADSLRTPMSLAWDGTNLYASDAFNRRITVYSLAPHVLPYQAVRNAASLNILATAQITIGGSIQAGDVVTITISGATYTYTVKTDDSINSVIEALVELINNSHDGKGDPNVIATADLAVSKVGLTSRSSGDTGNAVTLAATVAKPAGSSSTTVPMLTVAASGANLSGGGDAAKVAPGTLVSILAGEDPLTSITAAADPNQKPPTKLAGTTVYFNGIPGPLFYVSPTQINTQVPWEVLNTSSINAYVRSEQPNGQVMTTTPVAVTVVQANPGLFQLGSTSPATALVRHASSAAGGIIDVQGSVTVGDVATATIEDRSYSYTVVDGDTLETVRNNLAALINNNDPKVSATPSGVFTRIVLRARVEGPEGNGIPYTTSANSGSTLVMTAFTPQLCCGNVEDAPVTLDNPAVPGEFLYFYATGLGWPEITDEIVPLVQTGLPFPQNGPNTVPQLFVSSLAGGKTADVISATLMPGTVGTFKVVLHLNPDIPTDPFTPVTIAQDVYVSNVVTFPVVNPAGSQ